MQDITFPGIEYMFLDVKELHSHQKAARLESASLIVYDTTNLSSFREAQFLVDNSQPYVKVVALVGNKVDLLKQRKVNYKVG